MTLAAGTRLGPYEVLWIARIASPARARVRTGLDAAGKTPSRC